MNQRVDPGSERCISERGLSDLEAVQSVAAAPERDGRPRDRRQGRLEKQAESTSRAGWYLLLIGEYTAAEGILRLSLDMRTLTSVNNLGLVLPRQGRYQEAEAIHRRALVRRIREDGWARAP